VGAQFERSVSNIMEIGKKVKLISFNGTLKSDDDSLPSEDYWKLIGCIGRIVQDPNEKGPYASFSKKPRLLVQFEDDVVSLGLECHNRVENSLWILQSDLNEI
jgi:hypothetical protein